MSLPLQAHYLEIEWLEQGRARHIEVSPEPIEIEVEPDGTLAAETQIFHDLHPWVGLQLSRELADAQPAFVGSDGSKRPMLRIEDEHGGHWWIQNDGWDFAKERHLSELHRSMGRFTIEIGTWQLQLNNMIIGLARVEVEEYLRDFQQELVWLALAFGGATAAAAGGMFLNREIVDALKAFTVAARRVLANPARDVREVLVENRPDRLRPNAATFRQYMRNPTAQRFVGRGAMEMANIAENRYLRYLVQVCEKLSASVSKSAESHAQSFGRLASAEEVRSGEYRAMTHRAVDPEIFDRQLEELEKRLMCVASYTDAIPAQEDKVTERELRVTTLYGNGRLGMFFYDSPNEVLDFDKENEIRYSVLQVPKPLAEAMLKTHKVCQYFRMRGVATATTRTDKKNKAYRFVNFTKVFSVKPDPQAIVRKQSKRDQLARNGWLAPLSDQERKEVIQEARTAESRAKFYQEHSRNAEKVSEALIEVWAELRVHDQAWENFEVAPSPVLPMGVRFSQSPDYVACITAFVRVKALSERSGIGEKELNAIERVSVMHASALYERWCLVKIIAVLLVDYRFRPEDHWQQRLIESVTGRPRSFDLKFVRSDIDLTAVLEVQPTLPNGRRPDFRLRFSYAKAESFVDNKEDDIWDTQRDPDDQQRHTRDGLVLDAKFRTKWQYGELDRMLAILVEEKEYGQEGDRVFVLHPAPRGVLEPTSPLAWGRNCDYGQNEHHNHDKGHIYLAPGSGAVNPETNLRRLIAMLLQATFPQPVYIAKEPQCDSQSFRVAKDEGPGCVSQSFCIPCGNRHRPEDVVQKLTQRGRPYWISTCAECGAQSIRTHCYGQKCDCALFKNGLHSTYHRTVADQITNVACPKCGAFFDNDIHGEHDDALTDEG